ncbi:MAG: hypothetical protein QOJ25_1863 [Solirubrobacteraceae bacterium]|jgi:hypothetical protein|nr:hypothetical protein [Solirubrobacteraceae bacterium]
MILWWLGNAILLLVVLPVVAYLLAGVRRASKSIPSKVDGIASIAAAGSRDLAAVPMLLTTQDQVIKTVAGVADYGASLDVILDDAQ